MEKQKNKRTLDILKIDDTCTGCGACANVCPTSAITMAYDAEGFYYPQVDFDVCIDCYQCERQCHVLDKNPKKQEHNFTSYMCWAKDEELRMNSSSGGLFSVIAAYVLKQGGVVFGARYNYKEERLEHANTEDYDLSEFRKSKYIESFTGDTFSQAETFLKEGRFVLYCGAPCQIVGLKTYLHNKEWDNLILLDFICHGVPANKHFTEYKHFEEKMQKSKINHLDFRPKGEMKGWSGASLKFTLKTGNVVYKTNADSLYYKSFYGNAFLRKSCYQCDYTHRPASDITLADFWGIYKYKPELNDNKGISLALLNTAQGSRVFDIINNELESEELPQSAVEYVFKERTIEAFNLEKRNMNAKAAEENGFISTMKQMYGKDISRYKIRRKLSVVKKFILGRK